MGRFARDSDGLPASLEGAAAQLQASIERYTQGLLRGAEARASAIEEYAAHSADRGMRATSARSVARMMDAIDLLERRITESFTLLREEAESMLAELQKTRRGGGADAFRPQGQASSWRDAAMAELLALEDLYD